MFGCLGESESASTTESEGRFLGVFELFLGEGSILTTFSMFFLETDRLEFRRALYLGL
jgi:hypothetical protein